MTAPKTRIRNRLRDILARREYEVPAGEEFEGSGVAGQYLAHLMRDLKASRSALPDAGAWKVEFTSRNSKLTLFDKEADSYGPSIHDIISHWGKISANGTARLRRTLCGQSEDFSVADEEGTIRIRRNGDAKVVPFWSHDSLITAFARNAGYLIHVKGSWNKRTRVVSYESAEFLSQARTTQFISFIANGTICIEFDAYLGESGGVRDHGTKFRIKLEDLHSLYSTREAVG